MTDVVNYSRQLEREIEQKDEASARLASTTRAAEDRKYASSTLYGRKIIGAVVGKVSEHMSAKLISLGRGKITEDGASVYKHLCKADVDTLALLTLKVSLDVLGKDSTPSLAQLTDAIGSAIEIELKLKWYREQDKDLFRNITKNFHSSTGTRQKHAVFSKKFNDKDITWDRWGKITQHKVGAWAVRAVAETTGWLTKDMVQKSPRRRHTVIRYHPEFIKLRERILEQAHEMAFCFWPMVCQPIDWSNEHEGGYLTESVRQQNRMVRRPGFGPPSKQGSVPIKFLNLLQSQKLTLNQEILMVADWCYENWRSVGKFVRDPVIPLDECYPGDPEQTPEDFKNWKRKQRQLADHNAQLSQKNWRTTETMYVARKYRNEPVWYLPWSFDYRGRVYSICTALNPQGTDFDKALIYSAEPGPINEDWLAWNVATTAGHDKLSHEARRAWTYANIDRIKAIAQDPIGNIELWCNTDEPWCHLAAVLEYVACCIEKTQQLSGLFLGVDATCSGLQHLSSMTRDAHAAKQCNVIKGDEDRPSDGYKTVAEVAKNYIKDETIHKYFDRKLVKKVVMTTPYGVSRDSARAYLRDALRKTDFDLSIKGRLGEITTAVYNKAVPEVFAGPIDVMNWLQSTAVHLLSNKETIDWVTPSGFVVTQDIRKLKAKRIDTMLMGSVVHCAVGYDYGEPDVKRHKGAIAPNIVHSLDASLLALTFVHWDQPFQVIHDCVLIRSCDVDQINVELRYHHADMYKGKPLEDWADQQGVMIPDGLIKNTLNLDDVHNSPYFFC